MLQYDSTNMSGCASEVENDVGTEVWWSLSGNWGGHYGTLMQAKSG